MLTTQPLKSREESVLSSVIHHYVATAKPVGSQMIAEEMDVSSATIRNVLMRLEKRGLLTQPHTSAGRIPMDQGYRFYVDRLMQARNLSLREKQSIEQEYDRARDEVQTLMRHTAKILSAMTRLTGLAVFHVPQEISINHFKLVPIDSKMVMVILVLGNGLVKEEMVRLDAPVRFKEINKIAQLLNSRFSGHSLTEIQESLLKEAESVKETRISILETILKLIDNALRFTMDEIHMDGAYHLMEQPEFKNVERMEQVVRLVEEKKPLAQVLNRFWNRSGLSVEIGREFSNTSLQGFSLVHIPYSFQGKVVGALGVLGPTRMAYDRVSGVVHYIARYLEDSLTRREQ